MVKSLIWLILVVIAAVIIGAFIWVQDANQFKPDIEALIAEHSDAGLKINGDLSWQLWPPLTLNVEDIVATQPDRDISAGRLDLKVDLSAMWQDVNAWKVTSLILQDVAIVDDTATTHIDQFTLSNFRPGEPAPFSIDILQTYADSEAPMSAELVGELTYYPPSESAKNKTLRRLGFTDTQVTSNLAEGVCQGDLAERLDAPNVFFDSSVDDILPIAILANYNAVIECELSALNLTTETFTSVALSLTNVEGQTNVHASAPDFLGGSLIADADIDTTSVPARWTILPELQNVDSQRLIDWSDQSLLWIAPLALTSTITMQGNSKSALLQSINAQAEFDGGPGMIDVSKIKQQLSRLALLTQRSDQVASWPGVLNYATMTGHLSIDGLHHDLDFALDNLSIKAEGPVDYVADGVDLLAHVTVSEPPQDSLITINEWLMGTPIPMRCLGSTAEPKCRLDNDAATSIVANALQRGNESGLRRKLEEKIDEDVPEEYKEAAKGILDLLGKALERD